MLVILDSDPNDGNYKAPIPEEEAARMEFMDNKGEDIWPTGLGGFPSPIDLTVGDSPAVSTSHSQQGLFGNPLGGGLRGPAANTASRHDVGRHRESMRSPRRNMEDINLNAVGSTPSRSAPVPSYQSVPTTQPTGGGVSAPTRSIPPVSRQGRRPEDIHVLSSSATSAAAELRKTFGNTGHRKRRNADASAIAEGVTQSAKKMVRILSEINDTQKSTEREKLEVQRRHFEEQPQYKRERDRMNMENVRIGQEHTRLGLLNQQMVVHAIPNLASAISRTVPPTVPNLATADTTPSMTPDLALDEPA